MAEENFQLAKPLGDRVLIELKAEEKTASGIILTESAQSLDGKIGTVVAVGNGVYTNNGAKIPMEIKVGDKVMMPQGGMSAQKVKLEDKDYYLCREMDIPMVIR
jgi:chaperonin GroES